MTKILGVMGSPRKDGNTHILISKVLEGAKEAGGSGEIIFLSDKIIKECDGCHSCWKGNECSKNDDMNEIYQKINESDIIIFGTPVYWYGPTALIKAFLDRFVYYNCPENRQKIKGKLAIIVIPFEENNHDTATPLVEMFEKSFKYLDIPLIGQIIVPGVYQRGDVLKFDNVLKRAFKMGKKVVTL